MMKRALALAVVAGFAGTATAGQDVLWEQLPDASINAVVDQVFGPPNEAFDTFLVNDVSFSTSVTVTTVETFFTTGFGTWPIGQQVPAILNIFADDGSGAPAPGDDPTQGMQVTAMLSAGSAGSVLTVTGLSEVLGPGDYWVGLTPILDFGLFGQEFHQSASTLIGDGSSFRNPGGGFGLGTGWNPTSLIDPTFVDGALRIEGIIPAPATAGLLALGGLGLVRRRR